MGRQSAMLVGNSFMGAGGMILLVASIVVVSVLNQLSQIRMPNLVASGSFMHIFVAILLCGITVMWHMWSADERMGDHIGNLRQILVVLPI